MQMETKKQVKNVIHSILNCVSLILFGNKIKHNRVCRVTLSTKNSIALPLLKDTPNWIINMKYHENELQIWNQQELQK